MTQKPKIQYIGQFYVHGSEARQLELEEQRQQARIRRQQARQTVKKVYIDPVAIVGIAVALIMLVTMVMGVMQLQDDWAAYERMSSYVSYLKQTNATLEKEYREGYDLEDIRSKATALGMVPKEEIKTVTVSVTVPEPQPEPSRTEELVAFLEGLFA